MKKLLSCLLLACMTLSLFACSSNTNSSTGSSAGTASSGTSSSAAASTPSTSGGNYPNQNINGIVQWGAGGGTDAVMRPLSTLAEEYLGVSVVVQNMTGATGSIATQYVYDSPADGYNLLMGAENPTLYKEMGISDLTYDDFDCVYLIGDETIGFIVGKNSKYNSFTEVIEDALANPGTIKMATAGDGSSPWEMGAIITAVTGATFMQIPYDSDATAKTAVLSGECDVTTCKVQSGIEEYKAGEVKYLTMFSLEPVELMPDVPVVIDEYPEFAEYLPWGPFYGVFVKKGTDQAIIDTLSDAFTKAGQEESFQEVLANFNINFMGYSGEDATEYIASWQENTINALKHSGALD